MRKIWSSILPSDTTNDSIRIILNETDLTERDVLTEKWRTHKLEELSFIGIVVRKPLCFELRIALSLCNDQDMRPRRILTNGRAHSWLQS